MTGEKQHAARTSEQNLLTSSSIAGMKITSAKSLFLPRLKQIIEYSNVVLNNHARAQYKTKTWRQIADNEYCTTTRRNLLTEQVICWQKDEVTSHR